MAQSASELQNRELRDTIKVLNGTIEDLRKLLKESAEREEALKEQIEYLTRKLFGTSSEKRTHESDGQLSLFDEVEQEADPGIIEPECPDIPDASPKARRPRSPKADMIRGIRIKEVVEPLSAEEKICSVCGTEMKPSGTKYLYDELIYEPARYTSCGIWLRQYTVPSARRTARRTILFQQARPGKH